MRRIINILPLLVASLLLTACQSSETDKLHVEVEALKKEIKPIVEAKKAAESIIGTFGNSKGGFYESFKFDGNGHAIVVCDVFGPHSYNTTYIKMDNKIYCKTPQIGELNALTGDAVLVIKDSNTLVGENFGKLTYTRQ